MGAVVPSSASIKGYANMGNAASADQGTGRMNMFDLANLLDQDGNLQNEMMVMAFAATMLATIPVLLGNEFDVNVGLRKKKKREEKGWEEKIWEEVGRWEKKSQGGRASSLPSFASLQSFPRIHFEGNF